MLFYFSLSLLDLRKEYLFSEYRTQYNGTMLTILPPTNICLVQQNSSVQSVCEEKVVNSSSLKAEFEVEVQLQEEKFFQ